MDLASQIVRIRRFLRDPNAKIWDDQQLINYFNEASEELQQKTKFLCEVRTLPVPQTVDCAYVYDWEYPYATGTVRHQCFRHMHQSNLSYVHTWEPQSDWQVNANYTDLGMHSTQPWELMYADTPGDPLWMRFPYNFRSAKMVAYDEQILVKTTEKQIQERDTSYQKTTGDAIAYYPYNEAEDVFVLYPRPEISTFTDGEGAVQYSSTDTPDAEVGTIVRAENYTLSMDGGIAYELVPAVDNVLIVYEVNILDLIGTDEESQFPAFMRKYIEHGVLAKAFRANTDGRIESLADYWDQRYKIGVEVIKTYMQKRLEDKRLVLKSHNTQPRKRRHGRLPSTYPNVNP